MKITVEQIPVFFFDTADINYIHSVWDKLSKHCSGTTISGITTNPNALSKIGCNTIEDFEVLIYRLTKFLTDVRGDRLGSVHVQIPNSLCKSDDIVKWVKYAQSLGDGRSHVAVKLPPYFHTLNAVKEHELFKLAQINITGISDATTALRCLSYPITYASIIPGRMEEVGINADKHIRIVQQRNNAFTENKYIIAGSMRTVDGLKRSINLGCIPTIGTRVWDSMTNQDYEEFISWWTGVNIEPSYIEDIPVCNDSNISLTNQFFTQMDQLGLPLATQFYNS